jgi:hypothetical protein
MEFTTIRQVQPFMYQTAIGSGLSRMGNKLGNGLEENAFSGNRWEWAGMARQEWKNPATKP